MEAMPDDLDIASVGALYRGPWDKKYWSCSRGKDRYPYPVGYHAVRTHAGSTYRMEIHEGLKGPIFVVTSIHGDSCTGQTPDIAWQNFQKKNGSSVKNWHGKRFSCKIDGVELFGFRNPFVQRLLRELVANVNGIAERSLLSSNIPNGALQSENEMQMQDSHVYPDLAQFLGKQPSTGNRTKKNKSSPLTFGKEATLKRIRCDSLLNNPDSGTSKQESGLHLQYKNSRRDPIQEENKSLSKDGYHGVQVAPYHLNHSSKGSGTNVNSDTPQADNKYQNFGESSRSVSISTMIEEDCHCSMTRDELLESEKSDWFAGKSVIPHEPIGDSKSTNTGERLSHTEKEQLDRLSNTELEKGHSFVEPKDCADEISALAMDPDVFVPDTCDTARDDAVGLVLESTKGNPCSMENELSASEPTLRASTSCRLEVIKGSMATEFFGRSKSSPSEGMHPVPTEACPPLVALSEGLIKDSFPEAGPSSGSPNPTSERIDLDLAGQELARSMMTFLLPRAVPLLKKTYVKRRSRHRKRDIKCDPCSKLAGENSGEISANPEGKPVVEILAKESEEEVPKELSEQQTVPGVDSLCKEAIVQDSIEYDQHLWNVPIKRLLSSASGGSDAAQGEETGHHLCGVSIERPLSSASGGSDAAQGEEVERSNDTANPLTNHSGGPKESSRFPFANSNDVCVHVDGMTSCDNHDEIPSLHPSLIVHDSNDTAKPLINHSGSPKESSSFPFAKSNDVCLHVDGMTSCDNHDEIPSLHPSLIVHDSNDTAKPLINHSGGPKESSSFPFAKSNDVCLHVDGMTSCDNHDEIPSLHPSLIVHDSSLLLNGDSILNTEEEMLFKDLPVHSPGSHKAEHLEENHLASGFNCKKFGDNDVVKSTLTQSHRNSCSPSKTLKSAIPLELVNFDVRVVDSIGCTPTPQMGLGGPAEVTRKDNSDYSSDSFKAENLPHPPLHPAKYNIPLSESIICRYYDDNNCSDSCIAPNILYTVHNDPAIDKNNDAMGSIRVGTEVKINKKPHHIDAMEDSTKSESAHCTVVPHVFENQAVVKNSTGVVKPSQFCDPIDWRSDFSDSSTNLVLEAPSSLDNNLLSEPPVNNIYKNIPCNQICQKNYLDGFSPKKAKSAEELGETLELVGCYLLPHPVLSISISSKEDYLQISVLCGLLNSKDRYLFMYVVPIKEQNGRCPSFLGYTMLVLPRLECPCDGNISFTPDEQSLVFLNNIKAPHCREQNISCLCPNCKSDYGEENAVEVAYVKYGYVTLVAKLTTIERVTCILVCNPNYLIAAEESGRLHVWTMNQTWSMNLEDFMLPNFDDISPALLELKKIPSCDSLIIGHNGRGGFGIWDISQRVLLATFSSPGDTIFQIVPVSLFSWQDKGRLVSYEEISEGSLLKANNWLLKGGKSPIGTSSGVDLAVWVLVSSAPNSEAWHDQVEQPSTNPIGCWRLAILAKYTMIAGSILDPRASTVDASGDYGIIGTCDGLLYKWELSSGEKLAHLHSLTCGVSKIAIDPKSGAVVVVGDRCQLLVYVQR